MSPILSKASVPWPREWIFPPAMDSLTYFIFHFFLSPLCRCQAPRFHTSCFQSSQSQWDTKPCTAPSERFVPINWLRWNFYGHTIQPWCSWRRLRFSPECKVHHQNHLYMSPCQFHHLKHTQGSTGSDHHGSAMQTSNFKPSHLKPSHLKSSHLKPSHLKPSHLHRLVLAPAWNLETCPSTAPGQGLESERHFVHQDDDQRWLPQASAGSLRQRWTRRNLPGLWCNFFYIFIHERPGLWCTNMDRTRRCIPNPPQWAVSQQCHRQGWTPSALAWITVKN